MTQASANAFAFVVHSTFAEQSNLHCRRSADRIIVDVKCIPEYAFYILSLSGILPVVFASPKGFGANTYFVRFLISPKTKFLFVILWTLRQLCGKIIITFFWS